MLNRFTMNQQEESCQEYKIKFNYFNFFFFAFLYVTNLIAFFIQIHNFVMIQKFETETIYQNINCYLLFDYSKSRFFITCGFGVVTYTILFVCFLNKCYLKLNYVFYDSIVLLNDDQSMLKINNKNKNKKLIILKVLHCLFYIIIFLYFLFFITIDSFMTSKYIQEEFCTLDDEDFDLDYLENQDYDIEKSRDAVDKYITFEYAYIVKRLKLSLIINLALDASNIFLVMVLILISFCTKKFTINKAELDIQSQVFLHQSGNGKSIESATKEK